MPELARSVLLQPTAKTESGWMPTGNRCDAIKNFSLAHLRRERNKCHCLVSVSAPRRTITTPAIFFARDSFVVLELSYRCLKSSLQIARSAKHLGKMRRNKFFAFLTPCKTFKKIRIVSSFAHVMFYAETYFYFLLDSDEF